jgi:ribosomal protein S12 methylthiotransferase accessory factor
MEIMIDFPGGACVDAHFSGFTVKTDQLQPTGVASAPTPFDTFLASIGACAGAMVLNLCRQLELPTEGMQLFERTEVDPETGMVDQVLLDIQLPPNFPIKSKKALVRIAEQCLVKKHLEQPPKVKISASEQVPE